jgi:hypothetical protein
MSYLDLLNNDIFTVIFKFLDIYEIINLCIAHNICIMDAFHKIKIGLEVSAVHECYHCHRKCVNIKTCVMDPSHKLCDDCTGNCSVCGNHIGYNYPGSSNSCEWCRFDNAVEYYSDPAKILPTEYCQARTCGLCKKIMCHCCAYWLGIAEVDYYSPHRTPHYKNHFYVCTSCIKSGNGYMTKCNCGELITIKYKYICDLCKGIVCIICNSKNCECNICDKCIPVECYCNQIKICNNCIE